MDERGGDGKRNNGGKPGKFPVLSLGWMAMAFLISFPNARPDGMEDTLPDSANAPIRGDRGDSAVLRSETAARLRSELDTLGRRIDALKTRLAQAGSKAGDKAKHAGDKLKRETRDEVAALERAKDKLAARIDSLGEGSSDAWLRIQARAKTGMDSLKAEVDRMRKKIRD
jgi:polyhydroxyalkanoate synthesis regulator phasin